ncbi:MAG TPA: hypothetical protein VFF11_10880, partial [Candidatus Binatia bacterium]|nr:hypothetical protein [Candidatus Binatia bacterium]
MSCRRLAAIVLSTSLASASLLAQSLSPTDWGAPHVSVSHADGHWTIAGKTNVVTLNDSNLAMDIKNGTINWSMVPSGTNDMLVETGGKKFYLRLADAKRISIVPYRTGFKTGVKISLNEWPSDSAHSTVNLPVYLTVCLEGPDEDLVCDVAADERHGTVLRQLDWPTALDARDVDYTVLSNGRGNLLPRDWPKEYFPIRRIKDGKIDPTDHSVLQSHVIEDWSMSWWGFQKGKSAMMVICETPDDAAYQFSHPAGGPTVIGPRWLAALGKFGYPRSCRFCFFERGNYVTL